MENNQPFNSTKTTMNKKTTLGVIAIAVVFAAVVGIVVYALQEQRMNDGDNSKDSKISELENKVSELNTKIIEFEKVKDGEANSQVTNKSSKSETQAVIKQAMDNNQYEKLRPYLSDSVYLAAVRSDSLGDETPNRAVTLLSEYFKKAKTPWNFDSPDIQASETYNKTMFKDGMYYGVSSGKAGDRYVVSYEINSEGKIDKIYRGFESVMDV